MKPQEIDFYLGANTSEGFVSRYDQIATDANLERVYVIKGGPGTGKSSLMKKVATALLQAGDSVEKIHCSSDPDSLDAVISHDRKIAIVDGTPPHTMEPQYPGAFETIVDLYPCWDREGLAEDRTEIETLFHRYQACHRRACSCLTAAAGLIRDNRQMAEESVRYFSAVNYAENLARRLFGKGGGLYGEESVRFWSAVTPQGTKGFPTTIEALCDRTYVIEDDMGNVASTILSVLRTRALNKGFNVTTCYCVMAPYQKIDHLFIPQLRLGFFTSNKFHRMMPVIDTKRVKASRFMKLDELNDKRNHILFNKKASHAFIKEAGSLMKDAKAYHDELEAYYIRRVDFDKLNAIAEGVLTDIQK